MGKLIKEFKKLPVKRKAVFAVSCVMTLGLFAAIPVYAWFNNQRKAAEMFKINCPNSLYINAAHKADQWCFDLDGVNIDDYLVDPITNETITNEENPNGIKVEKLDYVFTVSGSNTGNYMLQLAHTNNNLFSYTIYTAQQFSTASAAMTAAGNDKTRIVKYEHDDYNHTQFPVSADDVVHNSADGNLYYVKSASPIDIAENGYLNKQEGAEARFAKTDDKYYTMTYGDYTNVESHSVPLYWQHAIPVADGDFCHYYILEVTWNYDEQKNVQTAKESDIVYISAERIR